MWRKSAALYVTANTGENKYASKRSIRKLAQLLWAIFLSVTFCPDLFTSTNKFFMS
jgi:hypothetical protein